MTTVTSDQAVTVNSNCSLTFIYSDNGILYIGHNLFFGFSGAPTLRAGTKYVIFPYNAADKMVLKLADKDSTILFSYAWGMINSTPGVDQISQLKSAALLHTRRIRIE